MSEHRGVLTKTRIGFLLAGLSLAMVSHFIFTASDDSKKSTSPSRDHLPASIAADSPPVEATTLSDETAAVATANSSLEPSAKLPELSTQILTTPSPKTQTPFPPPKEESSLILPKIDFWIWAGVGVNYTSSSQSVEGFSELEFGRIKSPSTMVRGGFYVNDHAGLDLGFKNTPGEAKSSETITVNDGNYQWLTMSAEALYRPLSLNKQSEWTYRLGLQQHQMPFLLAEGANQVSVVDTAMTNLSLGFEYKKQLKKRLRLEWMMRYQYPIAASNAEAANFHVSPNTAFDGSVGIAFQLNENTFIGVYWYGQYHDFDFTYRTPSTAEVSGRQSLFFTNFDLRLGMEF